MHKNGLKVIYIAGETRSGSTIVSNILGEIDGFFNAGELIEIWDRGLEWPCSCGVKTKSCVVWSKILGNVLNSMNSIDIQNIISLREKVAKSRKVPQLLFIPGSRSKFEADTKIYLLALSQLYRAIKSVTKCQVIIDSSKNIGYCYSLGLLPDIDLYIVHLIRDVRATFYSWTQKKKNLWTEKPRSLSLRWCVRNITAELLRKKMTEKYLIIQYENFIKRPSESLYSILNLIKENPKKLPFSDKTDVKLGTGHGICGNPDRFKAGVIKLRLDERWKRMKRIDKTFVTLLTWPLLLRYRYPLIPRFKNH
jgi:hypothetical protein